MNLLFLNLATSLFILLVLPISIFYVYTFYHLMNNPKMDGNRTFWIIALLVASGLAMICYWIFGKDRNKKPTKIALFFILLDFKNFHHR
ncbi:MAG: hypothetical protein LBE37_07055 [Sphingobacterium sp.]|nr:hypothetical protein [Sphingobacterium sp.]